MGLRKPRREIFEAVLARLGVAPEQALHVGDSLRADVVGAAGLGMRTAWLTRRVRDPRAALEAYDGPAPDFIVARSGRAAGPARRVTEPIATATLLAAIGILLALAGLASPLSGRFGVPALVIFLALGIAAGSEGIGGIPFDDYALAFRLGSIALVLILFDGGLNTSPVVFRRALRGASLLATLSVLLTALVMAGCGLLLGLPTPLALLDRRGRVLDRRRGGVLDPARQRRAPASDRSARRSRSSRGSTIRWRCS